MRLAKPLRFIVIFLVITGWIYSGWPQIFNFPPKVQEVYAVTIVLTSADLSPWDVPSDWNDTNTIEVVGAGGGGGGGGSGGGQAPAGGGGGGAYSLITDLDLTPGETATFQIGVGGGGGSGTANGSDGTDTIFNGSGSTCSAQSICAKGGIGGQSDANGGVGGAGGVGTDGTGSTRRSGGTGANAGGSTGGGAGGAAGDTAVGGNGSGDTGGDGGGSGGASGGTASNPGTDGTEWASGGSGGGGGGGNKNPGGAGGNDGGGGGGADNGKVGGNGAEGVIVIIYTPIATTNFTQNTYSWFVDSNVEDVTDVWGNPDIGQATAIAPLPVSNDPPGPTQELRLRVNFTIGGANLSASDTYFKLQYKAGTDATCTTGGWADVGAAGGGVIWRYAASGETDGVTLTVVRLSPASDVLESYVRSNPSPTNPASAVIGEEIEYDFHIEQNSAADATQYSFRAVETDNTGTPTTIFAAYTLCPTLTTEPGTTNLLRHGNFFTDGVEQGFFWAD